MVFAADDISAVTLDLGKRTIGDDGRYRVDRSNVPLCGQKINQDKLSEYYNEVIDADSGLSSIVIIRGEAGSGKTKLVESLRSSVTDSTWFVSGKFCDHSDQNDPFSALVEATADLIDLIVQNHAVELYRKDVKAAIENHELAFARLLPNVGALTGRESNEISTVQPHYQVYALAQFKAAFTSLLLALARQEHPLVIFLDDLQWVDDESFDFLKNFVCQLGRSRHIMLVGAVRTNESSGPAVVEALERCTYKASFMLDQGMAWKMIGSKSGSREDRALKFIDVGNVDEATVSEIISVALDAPLDSCTSLGIIVHQKTMGNPFAVLQFLDLLISEKKIETKSSKTSRSWAWDESRIKMETDVSDNVVSLVERSLDRLPGSVKRILANASFLGFTFDSIELAELEREPSTSAMKHSRGAECCVETCLTRALEEGLIETIDTKHRNREKGVSTTVSKYKFSHDRILQACFSSVSETDARKLHLTIGTYLQRSGRRGDSRALDVANHLNRARLLLLSSNKDRVMLARANFAAAKVARSKSAFGSSVSFLQIALRTLAFEVKWTEEYDLALEMSKLLLEMCVACGKAQEVDDVVDEVLTNAKCIGDKLMIMQSKTVLLWSTCRYNEAISYGLGVLRLVGERVSPKPTKLHILTLFLQARRRVNRLSDEEILNTNCLANKNAAFVLEMYSWLSPAAFFSGQMELAMYLMLRSAILSLENGIHCMTPIAVCHLGMAELTFGNLEVAIRNGRLALRLTDEVSSSVAHTHLAAYSSLLHWTVPIEELPSHFQRGMRVGMAEGDIIWAYLCLFQCFYVDIHIGEPLALVEGRLRDLCSKMTEFQMLGGQLMALVIWQFCLNLLGASEQCTVLDGEAMNEAEHANNPVVQQGRLQWYFLTSCKFQLARFVEETEKAEQLALELKKDETFQSFDTYDCKLHMVLLWLKLAGEKRRRRIKYRARARKTIKYMKKMRDLGCSNFDFALLLCEAEEAALLNNPIDDVSRLYDSAIAGAAGRLHHEAIAMEQAAKFYAGRNDLENGRRFYERSKLKYMAWNAYAKVEDMHTRAKELFLVHKANWAAVDMTIVVPTSGSTAFC